jgi:hypothetical protein
LFSQAQRGFSFFFSPSIADLGILTFVVNFEGAYVFPAIELKEGMPCIQA